MQSEPKIRRHRVKAPLPDLATLPDEAVIVTDQLSGVSGYAVQTLKIWRAKKKGPPFILVEGRPRYRVRDVREWLGAA